MTEQCSKKSTGKVMFPLDLAILWRFFLGGLICIMDAKGWLTGAIQKFVPSLLAMKTFRLPSSQSNMKVVFAV
jgi:hypothetical protein